MKMIFFRLPALLLLAIGIFQAEAGTIFYAAIPASQSDANSGISASNQYTSAVDGGNTRGTYYQRPIGRPTPTPTPRKR